MSARHASERWWQARSRAIQSFGAITRTQNPRGTASSRASHIRIRTMLAISASDRASPDASVSRAGRRDDRRRDRRPSRSWRL